MPSRLFILCMGCLLSSFIGATQGSVCDPESDDNTCSRIFSFFMTLATFFTIYMFITGGGGSSGNCPK